MTTFRARVALALWLLASEPLYAHEFWLSAAGTERLLTGDTASLTLHVGEFFKGEQLGFSAPLTSTFRLYTATGNKDLRSLLPTRTAVSTVALPLTTAGTHLIAFDSQPNRIDLSADRFHAYLHDEGLDAIKKQREVAGTAEKPARERYRRYVKTMVQVGSQAHADAPVQAATPADKTYAVKTGQRLEIVPLVNPLLMSPGDKLTVQLLFEGKPLAGALFKAWHQHDGQTLMIRATSSPDGLASFNLPYAGPWMISVVHMVSANDTKATDWDSLWGNLTFVVPSVDSPSVSN